MAGPAVEIGCSRLPRELLFTAINTFSFGRFSHGNCCPSLHEIFLEMAIEMVVRCKKAAQIVFV